MCSSKIMYEWRLSVDEMICDFRIVNILYYCIRIDSQFVLL